MTTDVSRCPKCNHTMERGYVADIGYGAVFQSGWTPGEPEPRRIVGGIKWRKGDNVSIVTYRCSGCGYLESYAREE